MKDIVLGSTGSEPTDLTAMDGVLYFTADDGIHGYELWRSDGTAAGTYMVKDINTTGDADLSPFTIMDGVLYFAADDGVHGNELWRSDGTEAGTYMVTDIADGDDGNPKNLTVMDGVLYFAADDGVHGNELWRSDGTEAGTYMVMDIADGDGSSPFDVYHSNPGYLTVVDGVLYFAAADEDHGTELWRSDGTEAGTYMVMDICAGSGGSYPNDLVEMDGILYFGAHDGIHGNELWRSDGTEAGTYMVRDVNTGSPDGLWSGGELVAMDGVLYFTGLHGEVGALEERRNRSRHIHGQRHMPWRTEQYSPRVDGNGRCFVFRGR